MASVFREFKFLQKKEKKKKRINFHSPIYRWREKLVKCMRRREGGLRLDLKIFGGSLNFFSVVAVPNIPAEYLYLFFFSFLLNRIETKRSYYV